MVSSSFRLFSFVWMAGLALAPLSRAAVKAQPNVVIITVDTLRADHLGCYGYKQIRTPNIDTLAADSVRFERAYTPVPVTLPAHTAIFTGTYPLLSGMHDFSGNKLSPNQPTLASVLKQQGYVTGAVVGSAVLDSRFGLNHGFDFYYDHFDFNRLQESNLEEMERPGNVVADVTLDWLAGNYKTSFFLWMHLYDPHYPYRPPAPYNEQYKDRLYDGEIAFADAQVGRLIAFLKAKDLYPNTIIILSGDHGESLGEHGERTHGFFLYNATLHVPVIIHLPQATPSVKTISRLHFNWSELRSVETEKYQFIEAPKPELYDLSRDPGETQNLYAEKKAVAGELQARVRAMIRQYSPDRELAEKTGLDPALMEHLKSLGYAGFSGGGNLTTTASSLPDPKDRIQVYELISDAIAESQHGEYQSSMEKLTAALKTESASVPVHYLLGLNYYRLHEFSKAADEFQRVLQLSPDYELAVYQLGLAYARTGDFDQAIGMLKRALQLDGTNFTAAYNLGAAYLKKQMVPEAADAFRQSITINPEYAAGHRALGELLLYQGQVDESLAELRRSAELDPRDPGTHAALARALSAKGLNAEADEETRKAQLPRR